jgi:hypothetical protein
MSTSDVLISMAIFAVLGSACFGAVWGSIVDIRDGFKTDRGVGEFGVFLFAPFILILSIFGGACVLGIGAGILTLLLGAAQ